MDTHRYTYSCRFMVRLLFRAGSSVVGLGLLCTQAVLWFERLRFQRLMPEYRAFKSKYTSLGHICPRLETDGFPACSHLMNTGLLVAACAECRCRSFSAACPYNLRSTHLFCQSSGAPTNCCAFLLDPRDYVSFCSLFLVEVSGLQFCRSIRGIPFHQLYRSIPSSAESPKSTYAGKFAEFISPVLRIHTHIRSQVS